jgi:hypothetical protein
MGNNGENTRQKQYVCIAAYLPSTIQTVLSAPEFHRFSPD